MEKKCKKAKWLSEEALQIAVIREVKSKYGKKKKKEKEDRMERGIGRGEVK